MCYLCDRFDLRYFLDSKNFVDDYFNNKRVREEIKYQSTS